MLLFSFHGLVETIKGISLLPHQWVSRCKLKFLLHVVKNIQNERTHNQELNPEGPFQHGKGFGHSHKGTEMLLENLIQKGSMVADLLN